MPNYQQGKIYSIRSRSRPDLIYIGSTTQSLSMRMIGHRVPSSKCSSKEIIDTGDAYIELIENFPCNDRYELNARENRHMRAIENVVNMRSAQADCPHGREQCRCVECHGIGICSHNKQKTTCIPCGGSSVCIHNKQKSQCIPCGGSAMCIHNKQKRQCIPCGGLAMCIHNKQKKACVICSPIECDFCNTIHPKGTYKRHLKTMRHKKKYIAEFKRVFDANMNIEDVPEY